MILNDVKAATVARLDDLITSARRLQALLDGRPDLPPFALARLAIDADAAVGLLQHHAELLESGGNFPP